MYNNVIYKYDTSNKTVKRKRNMYILLYIFFFDDKYLRE